MTGSTPLPTEPGADAITADDAAEIERAIAHDALTTTATVTRPPCVRWPDAGWISDDLAAQLEAAALCEHCPALTPCRAYVDEHPEPAGVWAGTLPPRGAKGRLHRVYHLDQPPMPADLDPGRPTKTLPRQARIDLVRALADRGYTERAIARMTGLSAHAVAADLTDETPLPPDLDPGRPARSLAPDERVTLAHALAERGTPLRVLAKMLGVSRTTAARYLESPPGEAPWRRPDPDAAAPDAILSADEATILAARIRTAAEAAHVDDGAIPELARLALYAAAGEAPAALGVPSLHGYLEHALGDTAPTPQRRQPVALALLSAGLSMRAAGALTATPYGTVGRWARQTPPPTPNREDHHP